MNRLFRISPITLVFLTIIFASSLSHAEIYRWTDENGKVHFSDKPAGNKVEKLNIKEKPTLPDARQSREDRKRKTQQYLRARKEERAEIEKQEKEKKRLAQEKKDKCGEAKYEYREIIEAGAVYFRNKDGTRDYLGEDRRAAEELRAKKEVKKWCG